MTRPDASGLKLYGTVVTNQQVSAVLAGALLARLGQTMSPLAILLLSHQRDEGFAVAGAAAAVYGVAGSLSGPPIARLAQRAGTLVLLIAGTLSGIGLLVTALSSQPWGLWVGVVIAGCTIPPLGATLRATIGATFNDSRHRKAAFGLDSVATEVLFVIGPALVGVLVAVHGPASALLVTAVLPFLGATMLLIRKRRTAAPPPVTTTPSDSDDRRLLPHLSPWLATAAAQMAAIGLVEVAVIAIALKLGSSAAGGAVLAVWAAGSVMGGLIYGSRSWPTTARRQLRLLLAATAAGLALLLLARTPASLYLLAFIAGLSISPAAAALLADLSKHLAPARGMTAFAWLASINGLAGALAYAAAGVLVAKAGPSITIVIAACLPTLAASALRKH